MTFVKLPTASRPKKYAIIRVVVRVAKLENMRTRNCVKVLTERERSCRPENRFILKSIAGN